MKTGAEMFDAKCLENVPWIDWLTPVLVKVAGGASGLGCRLCIASRGLSAHAVEELPKTNEAFAKHMQEVHHREAVFK